MVIQVPFNNEVEDGPLEPLRMEHFYLPFIFLGVGLFLSVLAFVGEVLKCGGKREKQELETIHPNVLLHIIKH